MAFRITGLDAKPFEHLFGLSDEKLVAHNAKRYVADAKPGYPCRITLEDAEPGETLLLVPHAHQTSQTAYASKGPIFVREKQSATAEYRNEIPEQLRARLISLRAYDESGMMLDADVVDGKDLKPLIERFFANENVTCLHAHFARRGCYAALIERV
jgi:FtsP/CotA-like multicopper oxidase with cupredoxin domain